MSTWLNRVAGFVPVLMAAASCAWADEQAPGPVAGQPWQEVVISVSDLDRTAWFFQDIGGYEQKWAGWMTAEEIAFWGLARGARAESRLLGPPGADQALVRLVRFDDAGRKQPTRPGARAWDTGCYFSVDLYVKDIDSLYEEALRRGWWTETPPTVTQVAEEPRRAVVFRGPDGVQVKGIEWPERVADNARLSAPFGVSLTVRDRTAARGYFTDVLGFNTLRNDGANADAPAGLEVLGIPRVTGAAPGASELYTTSRETGRLEIVATPGIRGHDHAARCVAPNLGILALRYPVASTKDALYDIAWRGGRIELFASGVSIAPYGDVRLFNVKTADGANLHFFERLERVDDVVERDAGAHGL